MTLHHAANERQGVGDGQVRVSDIWGDLHHMTYRKLPIKTNLSVTAELVPGTKNDSLSTHGILGVTSVWLTVEMFPNPSRLLPPSHTFLVQNRSPASEWVEHCCS